jgi:hypothetical protein
VLAYNLYEFIPPSLATSHQGREAFDHAGPLLGMRCLDWSSGPAQGPPNQCVPHPPALVRGAFCQTRGLSPSMASSGFNQDSAVENPYGGA